MNDLISLPFLRKFISMITHRTKLLQAIAAGCVCALLFFEGPLAKGDWTSFRNGGASQSTSKLPMRWSATEGIAWQKELIGYGQSCPVILGDEVFVTAVEGPMKDKCIIQCLDLNNGTEKWRVSIDTAIKATSNYSASRAAPTPLVDANAVYAFFESGDFVAVDHSGKQLWHRNLTADYVPFENNHGLGSSPAMSVEHLIVNIEHKGPSFVLALNKLTGLTAWKSERPSSSSWSSPIVVTHAGKEQVVVSSGGSVSAYDASTGNALWDVNGFDGNSVPSPTLHGSSLLVGARLPEFADENRSQSNCCIDLNKISGGLPTVAWRAEKVTSDYASPVVCGDCTYFISKAGILSCVDIASGELLYSKRLGTQCWSTPVVAADLVYFFGKDGKTQIIRSGREFDVVASNDLWDSASPPKPETYVEGVRSLRSTSDNAISPPNQTGGANATDGPNRTTGGRGGRGGGPGAGMLAGLASADKNGDGILTSDEIPPEVKPLLSRVDADGNGSLDQAEIRAMADSFAARRSDSETAARDPIVYGAVASNGKILIRTGTRLYCIQ